MSTGMLIMFTPFLIFIIISTFFCRRYNQCIILCTSSYKFYILVIEAYSFAVFTKYANWYFHSVTPLTIQNRENDVCRN